MNTRLRKLVYFCAALALVSPLALLFARDASDGQAKNWKSYDLRTPIVTNAAQAVSTLVGPYLANVYNVSAFDGDTHTYVDKNGVTRQDYRVLIGAGTVADGNDGSHGQAIAIGRDAKTHGPASCAIGPNTEVGDAGFGIAIGWRTVAVASGAVAIGCGITSGQDYWLDPGRTEHNPNEHTTAAVGVNSVSIGRGTRAEKNTSMAFGYQAVADAAGAVQLGAGTNATENTLKFQDVTIVKDGKVVGGFDPASLDPQMVEVADSCVVTAKTHCVTALECPTNQVVSTYPEIEIVSSGSRNFELFVDNTAANRLNLPLWISDDGAKLFIKASGSYGPYFKLPLSLKCIEPKAGRCIIQSEWIDDGYAWDPVVTNIMYEASATSTNFVLNVSRVQGTELHFLTNWQVEATVAKSDGSSEKTVTKLTTSGIPLYSYVTFASASLKFSSKPTQLFLVGEGDGFERTVEIK